MRIRDIFTLSWNNLKGNKFRRNITIFSVSICSFIILILFSFNNTIHHFDYINEENKDDLLKISISGKQTEQGGLLEAGQSRPFTQEELEKLMTYVEGSQDIRSYTIKKELRGSGTIYFGEFMNNGNIIAVNRDALIKIPDSYYIKGKRIQGSSGILVNQAFVDGFWEENNQKQIPKNNSLDVMGEELILNISADYFDERGWQEKELTTMQVQIDGVIKDDIPFGGRVESYEEEDTGREKIIYIPLEILNEINDSSIDIWRNENTHIQLQVKSSEKITSVIDMLNENKIATNSLSEDVQRLQYIIFVVRLVFGVFVFILLIVTGIGIFNTMMLSVSERKSEIGVAKSLGASIFSIRILFMMESIYIGLIGSFIGVFTSLGISFIINFIYQQIINTNIIGLEKISTISLSTIIIGILIPVLLSLFASFIPSEKAAKMNVLEAIKK